MEKLEILMILSLLPFMIDAVKTMSTLYNNTLCRDHLFTAHDLVRKYHYLVVTKTCLGFYKLKNNEIENIFLHIVYFFISISHCIKFQIKLKNKLLKINPKSYVHV